MPKGDLGAGNGEEAVMERKDYVLYDIRMHSMTALPFDYMLYASPTYRFPCDEWRFMNEELLSLQAWFYHRYPEKGR